MKSFHNYYDRLTKLRTRNRLQRPFRRSDVCALEWDGTGTGAALVLMNRRRVYSWSFPPARVGTDERRRRLCSRSWSFLVCSISAGVPNFPPIDAGKSGKRKRRLCSAAWIAAAGRCPIPPKPGRVFVLSYRRTCAGGWTSATSTEKPPAGRRRAFSFGRSE